LGELKHRSTHILGTYCFANYRSGAITTNEVRAFDQNSISVIKIVRNCRNAMLVLGDLDDFGAIENANARLLSYMGEKHWLDSRDELSIRV